MHVKARGVWIMFFPPEVDPPAAEKNAWKFSLPRLSKITGISGDGVRVQPSLEDEVASLNCEPRFLQGDEVAYYCLLYHA